MRWFRNKSFVVRVVNTNDVDQTEETVVIDIDKTVDKTVQAVLVVMGAYMVLSTTRQLIVGHPNPAQITNTVAPVISPVFNNVVNNGGHIRKIVLCLETGERWGSVTDAAKAQGKNVPLMSQHLNHPDAVPHINNLTFMIEGLATT
jgi:hypothetical protein